MASSQDERVDQDEENVNVDNTISRDFISEQIGKALENFSPFIMRKLNETLEGAMSNHIASKIKEEVVLAVQEEFSKRFPNETETRTPESPSNPPKTSEKTYDLKQFTIAHPPTYNGDPDPIVSTRWVNEIEGVFVLPRLQRKTKLCMVLVC